LLEPGDRIGDSLPIRPRGVVELASRLGVVEEHVVARHAQPVAGGERLLSGQTREPFGAKRDRIERRDGKAQARRTAMNDLGDVRKHVGETHILAAEHVTLANQTALQDYAMSRPNVIDTKPIE